MVLSRNVSLILLLLKHHLLLNLLLMQLLGRRQIEIVNDVCDIGHSILLVFWTLKDDPFLAGESILDFASVAITRGLVSFVRSIISIRLFFVWLTLAKITIV